MEESLYEALRNYWLLSRLFRSIHPENRRMAIKGIKVMVQRTPEILKLRYRRILGELHD